MSITMAIKYTADDLTVTAASLAITTSASVGVAKPRFNRLRMNSRYFGFIQDRCIDFERPIARIPPFLPIAARALVVVHIA